MKDYKIGFDETVKKQHELLKKLSNINIGNKNAEQKEVIDNITRFYNSRKKTINFFRDYGLMILVLPIN